jgi:hypothetical protein
MLTRNGVFSSFGRAAVVATVALSAVAPSIASAGSLPAGKGPSVARSGATDFSAARRGHYYRGGGGAAAAAAFAGIVGTGLAIAAAQNRRADYDDGYYGGPTYYAPAPDYYERNQYGYGGYGYGPGSPYSPY